MSKFLRENVPPTLKTEIKKLLGSLRSQGKTKIFGIGNNKTGTTSLKAAMEEFGYVIGHQRSAEELIFDWGKRDFKRLVKYCKTAQFFQDVPFSKPFTFVVLDHEFPGSKFILTIRKPEEWYNSITKFHGKLWGENGRIPTKEDLMNATYLYKGRPWEANRLTYNSPEDDPYNKEELIKHYNAYNESVMEYFRHRPEDLLVIDVKEPDAYKRLCEFLEVTPKRDGFPWKNKTNE